MADPISIFGATASVISILDILAKTIVTIHGLRSQWKDADLTLLSLTSQLAALRAALTKIKQWMDSAAGELDHQLVMDLHGAISCCKVLVSTIHTKLHDLSMTPTGRLQTSSKALFVFKSTELGGIQQMIDRQTSALTLLLTACNTNTLAEQQNILREPRTRDIVQRLRVDTDSLVVHRDSASIRSNSTTKSSKLSMIFDFDGEVFASKPYMSAIKRTFKISIRSHKRRESEGLGYLGTTISTQPISIPGKELPVDESTEKASMQERSVESPKKFLLLGTGESSKTTFLKQMHHVHEEMSADEAKQWRCIMNENLRTAFQALLDVLLTISWPGDWDRYQRTAGHLPYDELPPDFHAQFRSLLAQNSLQIALRMTGNNRLPSNIHYLIFHLDRLCGPYSPTSEDKICARVRTTGNYRNIFETSNEEVYHVWDVGGERPERKKWIHVFDDCHTVIFFASMACYDQGLYEDENTNRMAESLMIYKSLCTAKSLKKSRLVLCFTQMDIFTKKISAGLSPPGKYLEYTGAPDDVGAAREYITERFVNLRTPDHIHYLNATNIEEVRYVIVHIFGGSAPRPVVERSES